MIEYPHIRSNLENHATDAPLKVRRTFDNARRNVEFIGTFAVYEWKKDSDD